ncbi:MAG: PorV/PorQ family protein [Elusimicrobia bacterium]|nr:PorV/PorQ family protein [Elusimicrobiota bacterium]
MTTARRVAPALLLAGLLAGGAGAADFSRDTIGTSGSEFLTFDLGPRAIAMGGAYTALSDDAYSLYWNPAGLARVPRLSASYQNSVLVNDISYHAGMAAYRLKESVVLGAGWRYMNMGEVENTDLAGDVVGRFTPRHYVMEAGWGQSIYDLSDSDIELNVGAVVRWIHSTMMIQADGWGGDIGVQSRFYSGPFLYDLGASFQNMGVGQSYVDVRDSLPFRARIGGAIYPARGLTLSMEVVTPINNYPFAAVGVEYARQFDKNLTAAVRAGFNSRTLSSLGPMSSMSIGGGIKFSDLSVDYAWSSMGVLGTLGTHRVAFSYNLPSRSSKRYRER